MNRHREHSLTEINHKGPIQNGGESMDPNDLKFEPAQTAAKLRQRLAQMSAASQMLARNTQNDKTGNIWA